MRLRELRRLQRLQQQQLWNKSQDHSGSLSKQEQGPSNIQKGTASHPGVTLVLPVKGLRDCSIQAWASHLSQQYGGELETLFVVDDRSDPAHAAAEAALRHSKRHPGRDPEAFMVTGYPFDIPPADADLLTLCMLVYHLPLLIAFSVRQQTQFLYGGCMLFPLEPLRSQQYPFIQAWQDGAYKGPPALGSGGTTSGDSFTS
ncbi:hypothetical protein WJX84_011562 [Apatococcus fuscideae]|uniref:Ceramide glucosyltransferase n=1 Tax=Apatococcus fuscideae TaxID=2026836 RepID=A0AAW1S073_9CHLO